MHLGMYITCQKKLVPQGFQDTDADLKCRTFSRKKVAHYALAYHII